MVQSYLSVGNSSRGGSRGRYQALTTNMADNAPDVDKRHDEVARNVDVENGANINGDPEMQGLTLYEKKALLVNRELASQGMGRYQWYIFVSVASSGESRLPRCGD
jgi:hypothetical protein